MSESVWQDISTRPTDGTPFLAWQVVVADEYDDNDRIIAKNTRTEQAVVAAEMWGGIVQIPWNGGIPVNVSYTHWMPLPDRPNP